MTYWDRYKELYSAIQSGDQAAVGALVEAGMDLNDRTFSAITTLGTALHAGNEEMVDFLIGHGFRIDDPENWDNRWVPNAAWGGNLSLVKRMVAIHRKFFPELTLPISSLNAAVHGGSLDIVNYLIDEGVPCYVSDRTWTPFHIAARSARLDILMCLVRKGLYIHSDDEVSNWRAPLFLAVEGFWDNNVSPEPIMSVIKYLVDYEQQTTSFDAVKWANHAQYFAAGAGRVELMEYLVELGANVKQRNGEGGSPLHYAVGSDETGCNSLSVVKYLVDHGVNMLGEDENGETPVHFAVQSGRLDILKYYITQGADVVSLIERDNQWVSHEFDSLTADIEHSELFFTEDSDEDDDKEDDEFSLNLDSWKKQSSPLHPWKDNPSFDDDDNPFSQSEPGKNRYYNRNSGDNNSSAKEDQDDSSSDDVTSIDIPSDSDDEMIISEAEIISSLEEELQNGIEGDFNVNSDDGFQDGFEIRYSDLDEVVSKEFHPRTLLDFAAESGDLDSVRYFLETEMIDINVRNRYGNTPLLTALLSSSDDSHYEVVKYLLEEGASWDIQNGLRQNPLSALLSNDQVNLKTLKLLIDSGVPMTLPNPDGDTVLQTALFNQDSDLTELALAAGEDPNYDNDSGNGALWLCEDPELARRLIDDYGADPFALDDDGNCLLHGLVNPDMLRFFISEGVDINTINSKGQTPLMALVQSVGDTQCVDLLHKAGADFAASDFEGWTAAHYAAMSPVPAVSRRVIELGSDPFQKTKEGQTVLNVAAEMGQLPFVKYLLTNHLYDASYNMNLPLHAAVAGGRYSIMEYLVHHGWNVDSPDLNGNTPLHIAIMTANRRMEWQAVHSLRMIKYLVDSGADSRLVNDEGKSALDLVQDANWTDAEAILR